MGEVATLLDAATMTSVLGAHLRPRPGVRLTRSRPTYVRYKPGRSCLVQHDTTFTRPDGRPGRITTHVRTYADEGRARRRAEGRRLAELGERVAEGTPDLPFDPVAYLPEVDGLLQVFPVDQDLPFLARAVDGSTVRDLLVGAGALPPRADLGTADLVRYKPARKALLRYAAPDGSVRYVKLASDDRAGRLAEQTQALLDAGLRTPPVVLASPERGLLTHAEVPGTPLAALRGTPGYAAAVGPLLAALRQLRTTPVPDAPVHLLADEARRVTETTRWLTAVLPPLRPRLERLRGTLTTRLAGVEEVLATSHGDFYDDQAIVSPAGLSVIDLDELRVAHPGLDLGNLLAHLSAARSRGEDIGEARDVVLRHVAEEGGPDAEVALFEAVALLKLAPGPFRRVEPDWERGVERLVGLAEQRLLP